MVKAWMMAAALFAGLSVLGVQYAGLSHTAVPEHVTLTFRADRTFSSGTPVSWQVVGPAGAKSMTENQIASEALTGWFIQATADPGYAVPTFSVRLRNTSAGEDPLPDTESQRVTSGSVTAQYGYDVPYEVHVFDIAVVPATFTVMFQANASGAAVDPGSKTVTYAQTYGTLPTPTRTGYTFAGWYTAASGGSKVTSSTAVTQADDHILYARWAANTYTVAFNANGGVGVQASVSATYDQFVTLPPCGMSRTGYDFAGWSKTAAGSADYQAGATVKNLTSDAGTTVTLYAVWNAWRYTIRLHEDEGTVETLSFTYGQSVTLPMKPDTSTHQFKGWSEQADGSGTCYAAGTVMNQETDLFQADRSLDLYAVWEAIPYAVTFTVAGQTIDPESLVGLDADDPVGTDSNETVVVRYTEGTAYTAFPSVVVTNAGWRFDGWCFARDGVWVRVGETDTVPAASAGLTNFTARLVREASAGSSLAEALEISGWDVTTAAEGCDAAWRVEEDPTAVNGTCAAITMPGTNNVETLSLKVNVFGPGTFSFRWKVISRNAPEMYGDEWGAYDTWGDIPERFYFAEGVESAEGVETITGIASTTEKFSKWTTGAPAWESWPSGPEWREETWEIGSENKETSLSWEFYLQRPTDAWQGGTAYIDDIRWTGAVPPAKIDNPFALTFEVDGETTVQTNDLDRAVVLPDQKPTKEGYRFAGWNTQADGSGVWYAAGDSLDAYTDVTLYAQWVEFTGADPVAPEGLTIGWDAASALIVSAAIPNAVAQWRYVLMGAETVNGTYAPVEKGAADDVCSAYAEENSSAEKPLCLRVTLQPPTGPRFFKIVVTE